MTVLTLPRWRFSLPTRRVIAAELVAAAAILAVARLPWWAALTVAAPVLAVAGVQYRGATAIGWLHRAVRRPVSVTVPDAVAVELPGVGPIGMRRDGQYVLTVIALHGRAWPTTTLVPEGADTEDTVPLEVIAALLRQFGGLELHSVDVVSAGARTAADGRYTPHYDEIIGDRPAVGQRRTWLVLRLCPQSCLRALAYRGDVGAAMAAATERIRQALVRAGCRATICSAEQLNAATAELLGGQPIDGLAGQFTHLRGSDEHLTSYRIAGADLTNRVLGDLWTIRSRMTVVTLRITRDRWGGIEVGALVRFHTAAPLTHPPLSTLHPLAGQQEAALHASLPLGNPSLALPLSARPLGDPLAVPVGPGGVMLGMSGWGTPLLMPLTDTLHYSRITLDASLDVAQSLLLRAVAAGYLAVIHTDRPQEWEPICDERMILAGAAEPTAAPTLIVADGPAALARLQASSGERGHTMIALTSTAPTDCDVSITQISKGGLLLQIGTRGMDVTVMRPRNETQFMARRKPAPAQR